jgi:hypothetical protein
MANKDGGESGKCRKGVDCQFDHDYKKWAKSDVIAQLKQLRDGKFKDSIMEAAEKSL